MLEHCRFAAAKLSYAELRHVRDAVNRDLLQAMENTNGRGTQAHEGMLEMLTAVCERLASLPISVGPTDVLCETIGGDPATRITLANAVRVF